MKKKILCMALTNLVLCHVSTAQQSNIVNRIDFFAGAIFTEYKGRPRLGSFTSNTGLNIGGGATYLTHEYWQISSNLAFSQKACSIDLYEFGFIVYNPSSPYIFDLPEKKKVYLNYLNFSTTICLKYTIDDLATPYVKFGPRVEYLIGQPREFRNHRMRTMMYGLVYGAGIEKSYSRHIIIDVGFLKDFNFEKIDKYDSMDARTFLLELRIGYLLKAKKKELPPVSNW